MGVRTNMARSRIVNLANLEQFTAINVLLDGGHIPGFQQLPSCAQIRIHWILDDGKVGFNVLTGRYAGTFAGTPAQADAIKAALTTGAAWTTMAGFLSTTSSLAAVSIRDMNTPNNPYIQSTTGSSAGTSASPALPNEVAIVGTLRTAKTGPGARGRIFIPGWATNAAGAGNVVAAATVTAVNNWLALIPGALTGSGYTFVLQQPARAAYIGTSGTSHPARPASNGLPITSQVCRDNHWDSARRRGLK